MTETPQNSSTPAASCRSRGGLFKVAALVVISAFAGAAASRAGHYWHNSHMAGHGFMSGPIDPAEAGRKVEWMAERIASEVKATPEQRGKLTAIAQAAVKDLLPMREAMHDARKQARELFVQPSIDRAALEKLRSDQIANADAMSKRLSLALGEAADILTPEQRKQLADRFPMRGGWRHHGDRG